MDLQSSRTEWIVTFRRDGKPVSRVVALTVLLPLNPRPIAARWLVELSRRNLQCVDRSWNLPPSASFADPFSV